MNINLDKARDTLCKNILIYGYCKYENKGCAFSHTLNQAASTSATTNASQATTASNTPPIENKRKFNLNTPSFQPSNVLGLTNKFANLSPKLKEIPVFVPSGGLGTEQNSPLNSSSSSNDKPEVNGPLKKFNAATASFTPTGNPYRSDSPVSIAGTPMAQSSKPSGSINPYLPGNSMQAPASSDMYFQQQAASYPLQYHLYAPAPPPRLTFPLRPHETNANVMFIPNNLRETLQKKNEATLQTLARSNLPENINTYHSLVPIDRTYEPTSKVWKVPSSTYKVFSNVNGNPYVLVKINHGFLISSEAPFRTIKKWKSVRNANVIQPHDAFTTTAFGDTTLILAYDYYPNSTTLEEQYKSLITSNTASITEDLLWNYMIQLTSALTSIHEKGLSARSSLHMSKVLVTNKNRIRISSVGISDILNYQQDEKEISGSDIISFTSALQKQDVKNFGKLIFDLAILTIPTSSRVGSIDEILFSLNKSNYIKFSDSFIEALKALLYEEISLPKFTENYLSSRMLNVIDGLQDSNDFIEAQMTTELENARLFRLITKLNFIIDRPDLNWNENSNIYIIKLFRDFIFFQYDEFGKPVVDLSRVLVNLNKLDAGIDEKFLLVSQDEKSCIIVSYKEIRDIIDSTFRTLTRD